MLQNTKETPLVCVFMMPSIWIRTKMCCQHVSNDPHMQYHINKVSSYLTGLLIVIPGVWVAYISESGEKDLWQSHNCVTHSLNEPSPLWLEGDRFGRLANQHEWSQLYFKTERENKHENRSIDCFCFPTHSLFSLLCNHTTVQYTVYTTYLFFTLILHFPEKNSKTERVYLYFCSLLYF